MAGKSSSVDTLSPNPATHKKQQEQEQDLWIELYYGLLLAIASLPSELVVLQNLVEAHERFIRFFGPTDVVSLDDFKIRCDTTVPRIMAKLRQRLSSRIQKGGYRVAVPTQNTLTEERLSIYREEREKIIDDDMRDIDPEDHRVLWRLLTWSTEREFAPPDGEQDPIDDTEEAILDTPDHNVSLLPTTTSTAGNLFTTPTAPTNTPALNNTNASRTGPSVQKFWSNEEIAYLEFFFMHMRESAFMGHSLKMPTKIQICDHFNAFFRARSANFVERNVNQVGRYCKRKGSQVHQLYQDAERLLEDNGHTYIPTFTIAEFDQYLSTR